MLLVITVALALLGGAFAAGVHVGDKEIHQSRADKLDLVKEVVDPQLTDIRRQLEYINRKLDRLTEKVK
jgi:hypothetical protein